MEEQKSKVYVLTDEQNRILRCEGGYTIGNIIDFTGWMQIDEGTGDRYNLCQSHYFPGGLYTEDGIPRYKLVDGEAAERTDEEMEADRAALPAPGITEQAELRAALPAPGITEQAELRAAVRLARMQAQALPDAQALTVPELYPTWAEGAVYGEQHIVSRSNGHLYRCRQAHTSRAGWEPENTPALWAVIAAGEAGTAEDPIPAARGMEYEYGKYYRDPEDGGTYLCARAGEAEGSRIVLQYLPHELIGQYFEEVSM